MRKILNLLLIAIIFSCDSENTNDCFQKTGNIIIKEITVETFDRILVNRDIELIIKDGSNQKVEIETGSNLINDVEAKVKNGKLILTDNNSCNFVRSYGITKVFVTSPNITEIRSSTQYDIRSEGVLTYPNITLLSEDFNAPDTFTNGNFRLQIDNQSLSASFNNLSNAFISGKTNNLFVGFYAGTSRFEGESLIAQNVEVYQRSSNDMIVNPQQSIKGEISGSGDVVSVNRPSIVEVEEVYKGKLIFK